MSILKVQSLSKRSAYRVLFIFILQLSILLNLSTTITVSHAASGPAVFFLPHQDDEMFLAGAIKEHVLAGRDVYVVMATDGASSRARYVLNGKDDANKPVYCSIHNKHHNPLAEGYSPLTRKMFSAARNKEFFESIISLGVRDDHIRFANQDLNPNLLSGESYSTGWANPKFVDGSLTTAQATEILEFYFNYLGSGSFKTVAAGYGEPISNYSHPDHKSLYSALRDFTLLTDKRYYSDRVDNYSGPIRLSSTLQTAKYNALGSYYYWNPSSGRFAVGEHSVKDKLDTWRLNGKEYFSRVSCK